MASRKVFNEGKSRVMKIASRGAIINQHAPIISNRRKETLPNLEDEIYEEELEKARVEKLIEITEELKSPCSTCGAKINEYCSNSYHL